MSKLIVSMLYLIAIISPAMGVGIEKAEFFDIEQGTTATIHINFYTGNEPENNFTLELTAPDEIKDWVTVTPETFVLGSNGVEPIDITVTIPKDAHLGDRTGEIKYAGSRVMGGGQIGYTVATKTTLHFRVVKQGAKKGTTFLSIDAKPQIESNQIAKIVATIKNSGNIPTTLHGTLHINDNNFAEVYNMTGGAMSIPVGGTDTISLFWEPNTEGEYTGYFTIAYDDDVKSGIVGTEVKSDKFKITVGSISNEASTSGTQTPISLSTYVVVGLAAVSIILILVIILSRKK